MTARSLAAREVSPAWLRRLRPGRGGSARRGERQNRRQSQQNRESARCEHAPASAHEAGRTTRRTSVRCNTGEFAHASQASFRPDPGLQASETLLPSSTCDVPAPPVRRAIEDWSPYSTPQAEGAQVLARVLLAVLVDSRHSYWDPSVSDRSRRRRSSVLAQIQQLDSESRARAIEAYNLANVKLDRIQSASRNNTLASTSRSRTSAAPSSARGSGSSSIYTSGDDQSTLAVLLGASSIDELSTASRPRIGLATRTSHVLNR